MNLRGNRMLHIDYQVLSNVPGESAQLKQESFYSYEISSEC